jgi:hypothetical protein
LSGYWEVSFAMEEEKGFEEGFEEVEEVEEGGGLGG